MSRQVFNIAFSANTVGLDMAFQRSEELRNVSTPTDEELLLIPNQSLGDMHRYKGVSDRHTTNLD